MKLSLPFHPPTTAEMDMEQIEGAGKVLLDLCYAASSLDQRLDIFLPEAGDRPYPLVIYLHEGAFAFGSKRDARIKTTLPVLKEGWALATVEYRKSAETTWPGQIYDVKAAVRYLRAHADEYGLDSGKFAVWGVSAGGYLGAMLGVTDRESAFEDPDMGNPDVSSAVQAVIDWFGCCGGVHRMDDELRESGLGRPSHNAENSPESIMMGNALGDIPELCRLAEPGAHVHKDIPPVLIQHGSKDPVTPVRQSVDFAGAIVRVAGPERVKLVIYDADHDSNALYEMPEATEEAIDFLRTVFRS